MATPEIQAHLEFLDAQCEDFARMQDEWEAVFGKGAMRLRSLCAAVG